MSVFNLIPRIFRIAILLIAMGGFADVAKDMYLAAAKAKK